MNKPEEEVERKTIDVVFATIRGRTYYENLLQNVGQLMQHERCKSIKFEQWAGLVKNVVEQRGGRFLCHEKQHPEQYKYKYYVIKDENQIRRKLKKAVKNRKYRGSNIGLKIDPLLMHFVQQHLQVQQQQQQGLSFTDPHQEQRNSHPTPQQANSELILRNRQLQQLNYRHHHQQQGNITFRPYQLQQQEPTHLLQQQRLLDQLQQQQYHLRHQPQQNLQLSQMYQHHHHHQHQQQQLQQLQQMQRQQFMQQQFMQQQQQQLHHDRSGGDRSDDGSDGDGDEDDGVSVGNDDNTGTTERDNEQNDDRDDGTSSKGEDDNYNDDFGSIINDDVNQLKTKTNCLTSNSSTVASVDDKINPKDLPLNSEQTAAAEDGETTTKDDDDDDGYEEDDAVGDDSDSSLLLRNSRFDVAIIIIIYTSAIWWSIFRFLISIMTIRVMLFLYLCLGFGFTVMKRHSTNKLLRSSSSSPPTSSEQQRNSIPGTGDKQIKQQQQQQQQQHVNGTKPAAVAGNTAAVPKKIQPVATGDVMNNDGFVANNDNNEDNHEGDVEISSANKLLTGERSDYDDGDGDSLAGKIDQNRGTEDDNALNRSSGGVSFSAASTTATATSDNDDVDIDDDVNDDDIGKECVDNVTVIEPSNGKRKHRSCSLGSSNDSSTQKKFLRSSSSSLPTRPHSISDTMDKQIQQQQQQQQVIETNEKAVVGKRKKRDVVERAANNAVNEDDSNGKKTVANRQQEPKAKSKTRSLLLEYYQRFDPNPNAKLENTITIDRFLKSKNMYDQKIEKFIRHWINSGLVIMRNENVHPDDAIAKYDTWLDERRNEKYSKLQSIGGDGDNDNDNDNENDNDAGWIGKRDRKNKKPSSFVMIGKQSSRGYDDSGDDDYDDVEDEDDSSRCRYPAKKKRKKMSSSSSFLSSGSSEEIETEVETEVVDGSMNLAGDAVDTRDNDDSDSDDEVWNEMYLGLKKFHKEHNHCNIPPGKDRIIFSTKDKNEKGKSLRYWVSYQHRRMKKTNRGGAKFLTLREERLLNKLNFIPNFKETEQKLMRLVGRRIAKAFILLDNDKPTKKTKKIYFGTIDRISSVTNQWVRIHFDDGDTEDFDPDCVVEGMQLYEKYEEKDLNPKNTGRRGSILNDKFDQCP